MRCCLKYSIMKMNDDEFQLYDLKVEVVGNKADFVCSHNEGDHFFVRGENLSLPDGQPISFYSLSAILPLIAAKQRETHPNDWFSTDHEIACPDPHCGARFRIIRIGTRTFRHSEVTAVPLNRK